MKKEEVANSSGKKWRTTPSSQRKFEVKGGFDLKNEPIDEPNELPLRTGLVIVRETDRDVDIA